MENVTVSGKRKMEDECTRVKKKLQLYKKDSPGKLNHKWLKSNGSNENSNCCANGSNLMTTCSNDSTKVTDEFLQIMRKPKLYKKNSIINYFKIISRKNETGNAENDGKKCSLTFTKETKSGDDIKSDNVPCMSNREVIVKEPDCSHKLNDEIGLKESEKEIEINILSDDLRSITEPNLIDENCSRDTKQLEFYMKDIEETELLEVEDKTEKNDNISITSDNIAEYKDANISEDISNRNANVEKQLSHIFEVENHNKSYNVEKILCANQSIKPKVTMKSNFNVKLNDVGDKLPSSEKENVQSFLNEDENSGHSNMIRKDIILNGNINTHSDNIKSINYSSDCDVFECSINGGGDDKQLEAVVINELPEAGKLTNNKNLICEKLINEEENLGDLNIVRKDIILNGNINTYSDNVKLINYSSDCDVFECSINGGDDKQLEAVIINKLPEARKLTNNKKLTCELNISRSELTQEFDRTAEVKTDPCVSKEKCSINNELSCNSDSENCIKQTETVGQGVEKNANINGEFDKFTEDACISEEKCSFNDQVNCNGQNENCTEQSETFNELLTENEKLDGEFNDFVDDWVFAESLVEKDIGDLDLDEWQRCQVMEVSKELSSRNKIVQLRSLSTGSITKCILQGVWTTSDVVPGAIVSVKANFKTAMSSWTVDDCDGFYVENPDLLVTPTAIVGSIDCMRQGVLNFLFSKNHHFVEENSKLLAKGCLIHELLQQILSQKLDEPECIATLVEEILSSSHNVKLLYSSQMSLKEARDELLKAIPNIRKFCKLYSFGSKEKSGGGRQAHSASSEIKSNAWEGKIKTIVAIEDNYWVPALGLKGKIDVTVMAEEKGKSREQIMPIELKTGVAKNSIEHRGQVILYCLMAKQITPEVNGGLLVYSREGFARHVKVGRSEERDIVLLRNQLARHLTPFFSTQKTGVNEIKLPRPTNNYHSCEWCSQRTVCSTFLRASNEDESCNKSSAQKLRSASIEHLSSEDVQYAVHWCKLLWLEESAKSRENLSDLWCLPAAKREANGRCFAKLKLSEPVQMKKIDSYIHVFKRVDGSSNFDISKSKISCGNMVLLSTDCRVAIAYGTVIELTDSSIIVDVPRDLSQAQDLFGDLYMIDIYEPQTYIHSVLGNIVALLSNTTQAANLRRSIVKGDPPVFDAGENMCKLKFTSCSTFNESQKHAIKMACAAKDYLLIRGLPGSGKSTTVAVLIQQLVAQGLSVLVTAHTHSAVDTVLLKLLKLDVPFLRVGSQARVHKAIQSRAEDAMTKHCNSPEQLDAVYKEQVVIGVTCLGIKHPLFTRRSFDVCIVDESPQVLLPVVLGPLLHAKTFILVGDPDQLPPLVRNEKAKDAGLSKCLFTHLDKRGGTVTLDLQYRMNRRITDVANSLTYNGELKCGNQMVAEGTLQVTSENLPETLPGWLTRCLSTKIEDSVLFLDVPPSDVTSSDCTNRQEADVAKRVIESFLQIGVHSDSMGVIAPYANQIKFLNSLLESNPGIEISTVDQYQGRDKDIIIFTCTNNWTINKLSKTDFSILHDKRRLTVAITRARFKLILIGSVLALQCFAALKHIIDFLGPENTIQVPNGEM